MTLYELMHKQASGTVLLGTASAGTLAQATRKLYRAHNVWAPTAAAQGYTVQPARPAKAPSHG